MKDLIIGAADNYEWQHVRIWATSIKQSGFEGDVVLLAYRVTEELVRKCQELGIYVVQVDHDETGAPINNHIRFVTSISGNIYPIMTRIVWLLSQILGTFIFNQTPESSLTTTKNTISISQVNVLKYDTKRGYQV
jgi:hypothetical protein